MKSTFGVIDIFNIDNHETINPFINSNSTVKTFKSDIIRPLMKELTSIPIQLVKSENAIKSQYHLKSFEQLKYLKFLSNNIVLGDLIIDIYFSN